MAYLLIFSTIVLTCYGQLILKWRIPMYGQLPEHLIRKVIFLVSLFLDPYIFSSFGAAFIAGLCWMSVLNKLPLSHAYPFMAATFAIVLLGCALFFDEPLNWPKVLGVLLIMAGIVVGSQG